MEGPGCVRGAGTRPLWGPKPLRSRAGTEKAGCDLRRSPQTQPRCWEGGGEGGPQGTSGDVKGVSPGPGLFISRGNPGPGYRTHASHLPAVFEMKLPPS